MFDPRAYGDVVANILALDGNGQRLMPLVRTPRGLPGARELISSAKVTPLQRAALYVYCDLWNDAHETAQEIDTPDGSYWHAIVHRQEPDPGNAAYWFRQVGTHPIFPALRTAAAEIGLPVGPAWDPFAFIDYSTRAAPASPEDLLARRVQLAEWQLLFK
ncbi:MAG: hypothetical protein JWP63_6972 [Candidatus Solibacter sp.]|nr:hypothetical protein [Candidatus Solibacter sp.]